MKKRIVCTLLGHAYDQYDYGRIEPNEVDGIGRQHGTLQRQCQRCDRWISVCRVHIPKVG